MTYRDLYDKCKTVEELKEDYDKFIDDYGLLCNDFVSVSEENDKLKAEIKQLKAEKDSSIALHKDCSSELNMRMKEIERLKIELEGYKISDQSKENSSIEYYNLYKQSLDEIKQLKSELEQSDSCDGCKHELERNEYYCDRCKRISVDEFELKSEVKK